LKLFLRLALSLLFAAPSLAQNATLQGVITDDSGAVVPGARVTLTGTAGKTQDARSSANGSYSFTGLAPGACTVQASAPDLAAGTKNIDLKPGSQTLNFQLKVAGVTQ